VIVACSTLCFGRYPLDRALGAIKDLGFSKVDVAIHEEGLHLKPSQVAADLAAAAHQIKVGSWLTACAFSVKLAPTNGDTALEHLTALCRLARLCNVTVLSLPASPAGHGLNAEVKRLTRLNAVALQEGVTLAVTTESGTLTEDPAQAATLCAKVPALALTLAPSHFVAGPHPDKCYDHLIPFVRHVRLRDTGRGPNQFQVRVGQGEVEYGKLVGQLARRKYDRTLTVDIRDIPDAPFAMEPEVRKLKFLLESLV
jgi:sugar phosphate isomerase/epimerase